MERRETNAKEWKERKREIVLETTTLAIRVTKISMGAPSRERLVLLCAWPRADFFENTRGSQRGRNRENSERRDNRFYAI